MRISPLSTRTQEVPRTENRRVDSVQEVGTRSSSGEGQETSPGDSLVLELLELRNSLDNGTTAPEIARAEFQAQAPGSAESSGTGAGSEAAEGGGAAAEGLQAELRRLATAHQETFEEEVSEGTVQLGPNLAIELTGRPITGIDTSQSEGEESEAEGSAGAEETSSGSFVETVADGLDRVLDALIASRQDRAPGSLIDIEA